jgi:hypothetical protein
MAEIKVIGRLFYGNTQSKILNIYLN